MNALIRLHIYNSLMIINVEPTVNGNNFKKNNENPKKNTFFRIKNRKYNFPIGKLHVSIEFLMFYTNNCVFLRLFIVYKIIHFNFHSPLVRERRASAACMGQLWHGRRHAPTGRAVARAPGPALAAANPMRARAAGRQSRRYGTWKLKWIILKHRNT